MYGSLFNKSILIYRSFLLVGFIFLIGCETPVNNDSGNTVGCTNGFACNYGSIDICDFGTVCSDGTIICDGSSCSEQNSSNTGNFNINYISNGPIGGFQFDVSGAIIIGAGGGAAEAAGFTVAKNSTRVFGFSMTGSTIIASSGVLVVLDVDGDAACIDNVIISDATGEAYTIDGDNSNCNTIIINP